MSDGAVGGQYDNYNYNYRYVGGGRQISPQVGYNYQYNNHGNGNQLDDVPHEPQAKSGGYHQSHYTDNKVYVPVVVKKKKKKRNNVFSNYN